MQNRWFISISLEKNPKSACDEDTTLVAIFIQKLQSALASVETFPVVLSNSSSTFKALTVYPSYSSVEKKRRNLWLIFLRTLL